MLRHPLALGRGLDEDAHPRAPPEHVREPVARRQDPLIDDLPTLRHDPNLAFLLMQIDGTILHGWSPLLRLERVSQCGARKLPPHEGDQPLHPIFSERHHASIMEFENFSSVNANTRRSTPVVIRSSTSALTFSTPASANTTGVGSERVAPRLASTRTATLLTGANVSATRHAKMRREKLSITAWRYARVPSSRRMTVVSMCHISSARVVRRPIFGFAGCTRRRGRRQPYCWTSRYQVEGAAHTLPSRWARMASVPVGTCQ